MVINFIVSTVLGVISLLLIVWACCTKYKILKVDGKVVLVPDDKDAEKRYEKSILLQYLACVAAFCAGCMISLLWGFIAFFVAFIIARIAMFIRDYKS